MCILYNNGLVLLHQQVQTLISSCEQLFGRGHCIGDEVQGFRFRLSQLLICLVDYLAQIKHLLNVILFLFFWFCLPLLHLKSAFYIKKQESYHCILLIINFGYILLPQHLYFPIDTQYLALLQVKCTFEGLPGELTIVSNIFLWLKHPECKINDTSKLLVHNLQIFPPIMFNRLLWQS